MDVTIKVEKLTIAQAQYAFRGGAYTAHDLTVAYLERIQRLDKSGPKIDATLAISQTTLQDATKLDQCLAKTVGLIGRLHGIPILTKDQADTASMERMYGSGACKGNVPTEDASLVKNVKAEGAVILGKTTMSEWAIAAHFALLAVAEDTGPSIRCPASFINLVGLRPTPGLVSRSGFCPLVKVQDTSGAVARTVRDCALFMDCMVGFDPTGQFIGVARMVESLGLPKRGSYTATLDGGLTGIRKARVGVMRQLFGTVSEPYCQAVNRVINEAFSTLNSNERKSTAFLLQNHTCHKTSLRFCRSKRLKSSLGFTSQVAHGPLNPADDPDYLPLILDRVDFKRRLVYLLASMDLNALAFPDVQIPPPKHEDTTNGRLTSYWDFPVNTLLASQARLPAITVPAGFIEDGLSVGLELVGWEYHEQALLELAQGNELTIGARRSPPSLT
ncbi:hypothetical protein AUEXF2481DRAFT_28635 [Aureobasidium subglaciale EXF-2481]|uniref:Amidase domain-containing protein n=1 Tax=Aureobasidium subglaciale (strain EXF-2481) TaxID=1043005 RepID=A0A074ZAW6_AURSE|nr:uncharacterized protein AUEXF2481DRAFT_28635 [Aureobasidium subglaciale EXF-2481]KEQ95911.1 hypothetical protein AUEXF2481DRAFT_28635 [Aureobasidium subglaciale EXF-2481]